MLTIQELRRQTGSALDHVPDEVLARDLYDTYKPNLPFEEFAPNIGFKPGDNFGRGLKMAGRNTLGSLGGMVALGADMVAADDVKSAALDYANEQFTRAGQMSRHTDDVDNIAENPRATLAAGFGQVLGYAAPSVLSGGAGAVAGHTLARGAGLAAARQAAVRGALGASAVNNIAQEAGSIYPEMIREGHDDSTRALAYGTAAGLVDTIPEAIGVGRLLTPMTRGPGVRGVAGAVGRAAAGQAALGAGTEVVQTGIERDAAYKSLDDADAMHEYRNAAFLGALGDGSFGAAGGLRARLGNQTGQQDQPTVEPVNLLAPATMDYDRPAFQRHGAQFVGPLQQTMPRDPYAHSDQLLGQIRSAEQQYDEYLQTNREYDLLDQEVNALRREQDMQRRAQEAQEALADMNAEVSPQHGLFDYYQPTPADAPVQEEPAPVMQPDPNQGSLFNASGAPVEPGYTQGGRGKRDYRSVNPPELIAQQRLERAAGVAQPKAPQLIMPGQEQNAAPQPLIAPRTDTLDAQLEARRKAARGETLTQQEAFLLTQPLAQANPNATLDVPRAANRQQTQKEMFPAPLERRAAPVMRPEPVEQVDHSQQSALFGEKGEPTYAAAPNATDEEVAAQFGKEFGLKPTAKRSAAMAKIGRLYYDGKVDFDTTQSIALQLQGGKTAAAEKAIAEAEKNAPAETPAAPQGEEKQVTLKDGTAVKLVNTRVDDRLAEITALDAQGNPVGTLSYAITEDINPGVEVAEPLRRKGLATAMYDFAEANGGKIPPAEDAGAVRTAEGAAFRSARAGAAPALPPASEPVEDAVAQTSQALERATAEVEPADVRLHRVMQERDAVYANKGMHPSERARQLAELNKQIAAIDEEVLAAQEDTPNAEEAFDSDVFHPGEGPKYADLAPDLKKRWDAAVDAGRANQKLHDDLMAAQATADTAKRLTQMYRMPSVPVGANYVSYAKAKEVIARIQRAWKNAPEIVLVENYGGLPAALRTQMEADNATDAKGAFWDGRVYVISDNATSPSDLMTTVLHEVTGHFGLHGVLGERLTSTMRQIYNSNPEIRAEADAMMAAEGLELEIAVEEVLADMAEQGDVAPSLLEKIANAIRQFLRSIGLGGLVADITNGEVKALLVKAREFVEYGDGDAPAADEARYQATSTPARDALRAELRQLATDQVSGKISMEEYNQKSAELIKQLSQARYRTAPLAVPDAPEPAGFVANLLDNLAHIGTSSPVLGLMTMRQIADRFGKVDGVKTFTDLVTKMSVKAKSLQSEVAAIDHLWTQLGNLTEQRPLMAVMLEATMGQFHVDKPFTHEDNKHIDPVLKSDFEALQKRYNDLVAKNPLAGRIYTEARDKFAKDWAETGKLIKQRIVEQYVPELGETLHGSALADIAAMKEAERITFMGKITTAAERRSLRALWDDMDAHAHELSKMKGPYFPLMRFGDHVVTVKSKALRDAVADLEVAKAELAALMQQEDDTYTEGELKAAKKAVTKARNLVENLKGDEDHYRVEFFEKRKDAANREAQLKTALANHPNGLEINRSLRESYFRSMDAAPYGFMQKLEAAIKENLPAKDASAIESAVRQLYVQSMPERSALKAQLRRLNTAGVKEGEMRRALVAAGLRNSFNISRLEYGTQMNDALGALRRGKTDEQKLVGAELAKRVLANMEQAESNRLIDDLSNLSYVTFLGLSPSFLVLNATQPWTVSVPLLAARHGWADSGSAMARATSEVMRLMYRSWGGQKANRSLLESFEFTPDLSLIESRDERQMLQELFDRGIIDVTQEYDLGALAAGKDETTTAWMAKKSAIPAHHTEVVNRIATALAAYRLQMAKDPNGRSEAVSYAEKIVADSHLDYTQENSPRLLRSSSLGGLGKLVFQFKKYQQGMIFLTFKLMRDSYKNGKFDAESFRSFVYLMGAQIGAAGAAATPFTGFFAGGALIASALNEDDEDDEFRQRFYEGLKDTVGETTARLIMKGVPAAVLNTDVSNRLGMGDLLNPLKFAQDTTTGKDWMAHTLLALAGPAAAMGANWADAVMTDDPARAVVTAMPRFMAGPVKAWESANHGLETKYGNRYAAPEELSWWDVASQSVGFRSADMADMAERRIALSNATRGRDEARQALLSRYAKARSRGEDMSDVMAEIAEFNSRHTAPGERSVRITQSSLQRAVVANRRYERDLKNGVRVRKQDAALAEDMGVDE